MDARTGTEMIAIPAGPVTLSDRRTQRSWLVELAPHQLAAFPITQARYARIIGQRPSSYRVFRGGGWFDEHWSCRASVRRRSHPTLKIDDVGFRIARSIVG